MMTKHYGEVPHNPQPTVIRTGDGREWSISWMCFAAGHGAGVACNIACIWRAAWHDWTGEPLR